MQRYGNIPIGSLLHIRTATGREFFPQSVLMTGRAVEADMPLGRKRQHSHRDRIGTSFEAVEHPTDQRDRHAAIGHLSRQART
jgi:hypothetical protein